MIAQVLDDCNFHDCVNLEEFDEMRSLTLVPPEGMCVPWYPNSCSAAHCFITHRRVHCHELPNECGVPTTIPRPSLHRRVISLQD